MTKIEAARTMALDVRVWARQHNRPVSRLLVEERISEWRGPDYQGTLKGSAASLANVRTTLRLAREG